MLEYPVLRVPAERRQDRTPMCPPTITPRLCKLVSVFEHEPSYCHGLQIKNDVSKSIILEVIAINDRAHTGVLRHPRGRLDVQLNLPALAIDLVADEVVIME
jgi:hypothetical protein